MTYEEALAWIRGERSMTNYFISTDYEYRLVALAQADAAMLQQAYFVLKAWKEGLVNV